MISIQPEHVKTAEEVSQELTKIMLIKGRISIYWHTPVDRETLTRTFRPGSRIGGEERFDGSVASEMRLLLGDLGGVMLLAAGSKTNTLWLDGSVIGTINMESPGTVKIRDPGDARTPADYYQIFVDTWAKLYDSESSRETDMISKGKRILPRLRSTEITPKNVVHLRHSDSRSKYFWVFDICRITLETWVEGSK